MRNRGCLAYRLNFRLLQDSVHRWNGPITGSFNPRRPSLPALEADDKVTEYPFYIP